jgi:hypothetical protein
MKKLIFLFSMVLLVTTGAYAQQAPQSKTDQNKKANLTVTKAPTQKSNHAVRVQKLKSMRINPSKMVSKPKAEVKASPK